MYNQEEEKRGIYFEKNEVLSLIGIFFLGFSTAMFHLMRQFG